MSEVQIIDPLRERSWERFIKNQPHCSFYSQVLWSEVIRRTYSCQPRYFVLRNNDGEIAAALPLMQVRSRFTGNRLVSLPFADYCDPLLENAAQFEVLLEVL